MFFALSFSNNVLAAAPANGGISASEAGLGVESENFARPEKAYGKDSDFAAPITQANDVSGGVSDGANTAANGVPRGVKNESLPAASALSNSEDAAEGGVLDSISVNAFSVFDAPLFTPSNNTLITRDEILNSTASTAAELLKQNANIIFRSTTSNYINSEISMRGFGENSSSRVLVLVDGHRLSRIDSSSVNWAQIPLAHIDSVEVLRGSHSAEYGSGALAGVIKINTLKGSDLNEASFSAAYGSYDYTLFNADLIGRQGDVYASLNLNSLYDGGYRENSRGYSNGVSASVGYDVFDSTTLELGGNFSESGQRYPGALGFSDIDSSALDNPQSSLVSDSSGHGKNYLATFNINSRSTGGRFDMENGFNLFDMRWSNSGAFSKNLQWTASAYPRYEFIFNDTNSVTVGVDFSYDSVDVKRYLDKDYCDNHARADMQRENFAPYIKGEIEVLEDLTLTLAGRFDASHVNAYSIEYDPRTVPEYIYIRGQKRKNPYPLTILSEESHSKWLHGFAANAGLNWRMDNNSSVFFRFDQIYRYPTSNEIFAYEGYVLAKVFQDDLNPETGQNYELGYKYISAEWTFVANLFAQPLKDEISYDDAKRLNVNLDPTLRYGADFELRYDEPLWGASALASVTRAQFCGGKYSGNAVPLVPLANTTLSAYVKPLEMLRLTARVNGLTAQYQGGDYDNAQRKIPAYATLDLQVDLFFSPNFRVFASADNILDKRYISAAWWGSGAYPGVGRTFKIGASIRF